MSMQSHPRVFYMHYEFLSHTQANIIMDLCAQNSTHRPAVVDFSLFFFFGSTTKMHNCQTSSARVVSNFLFFCSIVCKVSPQFSFNFPHAIQVWEYHTIGAPDPDCPINNFRSRSRNKRETIVGRLGSWMRVSVWCMHIKYTYICFKAPSPIKCVGRRQTRWAILCGCGVCFGFCTMAKSSWCT